ncbi:Transposable element Tc1 transposase [Araneus ventricosus]|uniref:Transposable element Tc1 transposase n=1 Tax=Araneus ventricosus TaxID=182803 RepID=A0A4Y2TMP7_ARAVE|nr:Transposable element Tc1 transposase [Araneus ventricosus]
MEHSYTEREIAAKLEIPPSTVHYWLTKREPTKKTGRHRKTDERTDQLILRTSESDPFLPATVIKRQLGLPCSSETVRRRLKEQGLKNRAVATKPFLKEIHRKKRLDFAMYYINYGLHNWFETIFSDEKIFSSSGFGHIRVWRPDGERFKQKYMNSKNQSGRFSIAVWICIGVINRIHLITQKSLNTQYYVRNILTPILGEIEETDSYTFMHDLSPIHTSKYTKAWLINHGINVLWNWPPKGADLNPVENVWAEIERRISNRSPANKTELWEIVRDTFQELTGVYIVNLIQSMPNRMKLVIENDGLFTRY